LIIISIKLIPISYFKVLPGQLQNECIIIFAKRLLIALNPAIDLINDGIKYNSQNMLPQLEIQLILTLLAISNREFKSVEIINSIIYSFN
jgi:hypothetical protein